MACAGILLLVVASLFAVPVSFSAEQPGTAHGIAVYRGVGVPLVVTVEVEPGNGSLEVAGVCGDQLFMESLRIAAFEAAWISGLDPWSLNYTIHVLPAENITCLTGTSLSLAAYLATLSAIRGLQIPSDIIMTGMINPDSTVGFVGRLPEKAHGAQANGYRVFIYPALQDYEYDIVERNVHLGPYVFTTSLMEVRPQNFTGINISLIQVAGGPEFFSILWNTSKPPALRIHAFNMIAGPAYVVIQDFVNDTERRIVHMLQEIAELRASGRLSLTYPSLDRAVEETYQKALAYLGAYRNLSRSGLILVSYEYLAVSYRYAAYAYYLARFFSLPDGDTLNGIYMDYASRINLLKKVLRTATNRPLSTEQVLLLAEAYRILHDSERQGRIVSVGIQAISAGFLNGAAIKVSVARTMAGLLEKIFKAQIMVLIALGTTPSNTVDPGKLARLSQEYAALLVDYARRYSLYSRVFSEIIQMAGGSLWMSRRANMSSLEGQLLALGYALESISYSQLYLALHPGVGRVADVRYDALLRNLALYIQSANNSVPPSVQWYIERALVYEDNASRIMYLEKALTHLKFYIVAEYLAERSSASSPALAPEIDAGKSAGTGDVAAPGGPAQGVEGFSIVVVVPVLLATILYSVKRKYPSHTSKA